MADTNPSERLSLEDKLTNLARCGIKLSEPFTIDTLLASVDRDYLEQPGYDNLLSSIGITEEQPPWRQLCSSYFYFDSECIEDDGCYTEYIEQIAAMAAGEIELAEITENVNVETGGPSSLSLRCNNRLIKMEFDQIDDWFNYDVLYDLLLEFNRSGAERKYFIRDNEDTTVEIGCLYPEQIVQLRQLGIEAPIA